MSSSKTGAFGNMSEPGKYVCGICGQELKGKYLDLARGRDRSFFTYSWKVGPETKELWKRSLSAVFCEKCVSESEKWDKKYRVCINCFYFALNLVGLPNVPEVYCMARTKGIAPLEETCEKWMARRPL